MTLRRREILTAAVPATLGMPALAEAMRTPPPLPEVAGEADADRYWAGIRRDHFLLPDDYVYLHTGTLGVPPRAVINAVARGLLQSGTVGFAPLNRWGAPIEQINAREFEPLRADLARAFGCDTGELTLTNNTTAALAMLASGLPLRPGDTVLITTLEHPANIRCWERAERDRGITVARVPLPLARPSDDAIVEAFARAFGPTTKVLSFAAIPTGTGVRLPVERIVAAARARGIITLVDGAHLPGQVPLDLHALGCDYLAASPHKWLFAPAGCGFLYGRGEGLARLAERLAPDGDEAPPDRLMQIGTNSGPIFDGFAEGLRFHQRLGPAAIFARLAALRDHMLRRALAVPNVEIYTPEDPAASAGMVAFRVRGVELHRFSATFEAARIRVAPGNGVRLSAHVHTRRSDIDRFFDVLAGVLKGV